MNKLKSFKHSSFENNDSYEANERIKESKNNPNKILCNHCGRTAFNGIRCLGICVADNEY